jgi:hypothetical protein
VRTRRGAIQPIECCSLRRDCYRFCYRCSVTRPLHQKEYQVWIMHKELKGPHRV